MTRHILLCLFATALATSIMTNAAEDKEEEIPPEVQAQQATAIIAVAVNPETVEKSLPTLAAQLAKLGENIITPVTQALRDDELDVKRADWLVLLLMRLRTPQCVPALKRTLARKDRAGIRALNALGRITSPAAYTAILAYKPHDANATEALIVALGAVPGETAEERLVTYLIAADARDSTRARQALALRFSEDAEGADDLVEDVLDTFRSVDEEDFPNHVAANLVDLVADLPDEDAAEVMVDVIEARNEIFRDVALKKVATDIELAGAEPVLNALWNILYDDTANAEVLISTLEVMRALRIEDAGPIVAELLDHSERKVVVKTTETLEAIYKVRVGRNPVKWKQWLAENEK